MPIKPPDNHNDPKRIGYILNFDTANVGEKFTGRFLSVNENEKQLEEDSRNANNTDTKNRAVTQGNYRENQIPYFIRKYYENTPENDDFAIHFLEETNHLVELPNSRTAQLDTKLNSQTKEFRYFPTEANIAKTCVAELKIDSEHCQIYYYDNVDDEKYGEEFINPKNEEFQKLADFFDEIYERETNILGKTNVTDTHGGFYINSTESEKILIFVHDLFGDAEKDSAGGTYGYFHPRDLVATGRNGLNKALMVYIDSDYLKKFPESIYSTLVHEFAHLLNYINKVINKNTSWTSWFTEMLAMNAEDVIFEKGSSDKDWVANARIPYFLCNYNAGFFNWDFSSNSTLEDQLIIYGNTYTFGAYLLRNYGGIKLIYEMATNDYFGVDSISAALHACGYLDENFDSVLAKFPLVIANVNANGENFISLNKNVPQTKIGDFSYRLPEINLYKFYYENNNKKIYGPWFATRGKSYGLDAWGFVAFKLNDTINYNAPINKNVEMFFYSQETNELEILIKE